MSETGTNGHSQETDCIRIRGARVHNLKNINLDIPRDRLVVLTGLSGSGKSSLAFDTIYAEGQRQYVESLSVYARQFLDQMDRPDVDLIDGLQPTIAIDQQGSTLNPRSTVATATEIYDYLRVLMARLGQPHCHVCGEAIRQQAPEQIIEDLFTLPDRTKAMLLAPFVRGRKGQHADALAEIRKAGFVRVRVDGMLYEIDGVPELNRQRKHTIEAVVDRIMIREEIRPRLAESLNLALKHGDGVVIVACLEEGGDSTLGPWHDRLYSTKFACPSCKVSYAEIEPRTFSFNSPYGACPACEGLGTRTEFDPELILPDAQLAISGGAIAPWRGAGARGFKQHKKELAAFLQAAGGSLEQPLVGLKPKTLEALLHGDGKEFAGILVWLAQQLVTATDPAEREHLESYRGAVACAECGGTRLRPEGRNVRLAGHTIGELTAMTVVEAEEYFGQLTFVREEAPIGEPVRLQVANRLGFLRKVGLDYLTLDRATDTLSGGEAQRIRLASGIGSGLVGVCYVLDEPSIGLHQRDNDRLIQALRELQRCGNSVLVVEHDEATMREADYLIDLGPGPGEHGGQVVAEGTPVEVIANPASLTGRFLAGTEGIELPARRRKTTAKHALVLEGVTTNNLKDVDVKFPLSALVAVTGVSGSGKSSLLNETLARALVRRLGGAGPKPGPHRSLRGVRAIDKFIQIDQTPIGRTPRSNPATFLGLFDEIRKVFANTRDAKLRGYGASRFSFNVKGGRCEECQGHGLRKIEMNFLSDLYVNCPACNGARFNPQTLAIRYKESSIAEVLDMSVDRAVEFFENFPVIARQLQALVDVGLGYLRLGQPSVTLSGGEAQRIKLAAELGRVATGKTLYLLDEPTTGLHFEDVKKLLAVLQRLVDLGNTVIVIEHNLEVVKSADWIIDLGPEGGAAGGHILAEATPEDLARIEDNSTGQFLRPLLNGHLAASVNGEEGLATVEDPPAGGIQPVE
jgi:excinuclease ABC subunit A